MVERAHSKLLLRNINIQFIEEIMISINFLFTATDVSTKSDPKRRLFDILPCLFSSEIDIRNDRSLQLQGTASIIGHLAM